MKSNQNCLKQKSILLGYLPFITFITLYGTRFYLSYFVVSFPQQQLLPLQSNNNCMKQETCFTLGSAFPLLGRHKQMKLHEEATLLLLGVSLFLSLLGKGKKGYTPWSKTHFFSCFTFTFHGSERFTFLHFYCGKSRKYSSQK